MMIDKSKCTTNKRSLGALALGLSLILSVWSPAQAPLGGTAPLGGVNAPPTGAQPITPPTVTGPRAGQSGGQQAGPQFDFPTAFSPMPEPPQHKSKAMQVWEAVCWYLPNRIMD